MTLMFASSCEAEAAHLEEEMQILDMYYKKKDLVVSATRHLKPISQVAENITVVTAKEIEKMNAHTVAEVLNRLTGVFVLFSQNFGADSRTYIQSSEPRLVLVLVDGVPWNFLNAGHAETNSIPIGIVERIEVIKGPASSAWGSSLGGVVNIITKPVGHTARPAGSIRASYGERNTQDYRAEASGLAGPAGYYLFAGRQESDGLRSERYFDNDSFYSKFKVPISNDVDAGLSIGYSEPHIKFALPGTDSSSTGLSRTFFVTASLDAILSKSFTLNISLYHFRQKFVQDNYFSGFPLEYVYDEETTGGTGKFVWEYGKHTAVLGVDVDLDHGKLDQEIRAGSAPPLEIQSDIERWAVYVNDTIVIDRLSVTPGIRYDYNNITGSFTSPSLGLTYKLGENSIVRGSVARGFTIPPLSWTSGGGLFFDPNSDLEPEKVWSYQAGAESSALKYCWLKATLFRHDMKNALISDPERLSPPFRSINQGKIRRKGIELEVETIPIYDFSLLAGFGYVRIEPARQPDTETSKSYTYNIGVRYDKAKSFRAELFGHYIWWNVDSALNGKYDDFVWDLHLNKRIYATEKTATEVFLTAHNIFNGSQYVTGDDKNPRRWVEAGLRFAF